jgi:hypothetical protein
MSGEEIDMATSLVTAPEAAEMTLENTWSRRETARELDCDPRTVDRLADAGQLARFKVGPADSRAAHTKNGQDKRPVRFSKSEVAALKDARTRPVLASA